MSVDDTATTHPPTHPCARISTGCPKSWSSAAACSWLRVDPIASLQPKACRPVDATEWMARCGPCIENRLWGEVVGARASVKTGPPWDGNASRLPSPLPALSARECSAKTKLAIGASSDCEDESLFSPNPHLIQCPRCAESSLVARFSSITPPFPLPVLIASSCSCPPAPLSLSLSLCVFVSIAFGRPFSALVWLGGHDTHPPQPKGRPRPDFLATGGDAVAQECPQPNLCSRPSPSLPSDTISPCGWRR
jgi:hypothetical protein